MDFQQHEIPAERERELDAQDTFAEGLGFTAGRPCPLPIETTWVLAASWLLLAAGNLCIQYRVHEYLALQSVLLRVAVTVFCALCATEFYDYWMMHVNKIRTIVIVFVEEALLMLLGHIFRIPRDEDRPRGVRVEQLWQRGTWQTAHALYAILSEILSRLCDGLVMVAHAAFWWPPNLVPWTQGDSSGLAQPLIFMAYFVWYWMVLFVVLQYHKQHLPRTVLSVLDWLGWLVQLPSSFAFRRKPVFESALWYLQKSLAAATVGFATWGFLWANSRHIPAHTAHAWDRAIKVLHTVIQRDGMVLNHFVPDTNDLYPATVQLGLQVGLQAVVAALCCALMVLHRIMLDYQLQVNRAHREMGLRALDTRLVGLEDRFSAAWYRSVAVNLMAFTAYQLFSFARTALGAADYLDSLAVLNSPWRILLFTRYVQRQIYSYLIVKSLLISLATALALYLVHLLLRQGTWVVFRLLVSTDTFDLLVYWYTGIVAVFTSTIKPGLYPIVYLDFRMANKPLLAHALMSFLFKPEGPLVIVSPNASVIPFDPEGWW